jgi:hypothetical protein
MLLNNPEYGLEWAHIPSSGPRSSPCRNFYTFLYGSDDGYDEAKQMSNKDGMFIMLDKTTNHVRVVVKDQTYDVQDAPPKAKQVSIPNSVQQLLRGSNYIPAAIAGSVLGTAALAGGIAYAVKNRGVSNSPSRTDLAVGGGGRLSDGPPNRSTRLDGSQALSGKPTSNAVPATPSAAYPGYAPDLLELRPSPEFSVQNEAGTISALERIFRYVEPQELASPYVSTNVPGTFYLTNAAQKQALALSRLQQLPADVKVDIQKQEGNVRPGTYVYRMHLGSIEIVLPLVWCKSVKDDDLKRMYEQPWVYFYRTSEDEWRYFPNKSARPLVKWSDGVYVDDNLPILLPSGVSTFNAAYNSCKSTIIDFAYVHTLYNIFYEVWNHDLAHPGCPTKRQQLGEMMENSHIMCTQKLKDVLTETIKAVRSAPTHPVHAAYASIHTWKDLANRLLTKRILWYYGTLDLWGFNDQDSDGNIKHVERQGSDSYMEFASTTEYRNYLHPDESIISSLLGLKVHSFSYDNGARHPKQGNKAKPERQMFDTEVVMLAQVGARLEPHRRIEQGDVILVDETVADSTPFQTALRTVLTTIDDNLYVARSRIVLDQAVNAAITHSKPTHLILTGLGQEYWQGAYGNITAPAFTTALVQTLSSIIEPKNLRALTIIAYQIHESPTQDGRTALENATAKLPDICKEKGIHYTWDEDYKGGVFNRRPIQDEDLVDMFSFAWDGMSLVGNEYYDCSGDVSADPAAAYSTSVAFVAHPRINPSMYKRFGPTTL